MAFLLTTTLATPAWALRRGDVVVIKNDADLKVSGKVVGKVKAGDVWRVHGVRGAWVEVGEDTRGWVRTDNVLTEQESLEHISKQIAARPADAKLLITRARMRLSPAAGRDSDSAQRLDDAEADLREALRAEPASAEAHYYLAQISLRRNDASEALRELNEAIELDDKDARFFAERGKLLELRNQKVQTMQDLEKVVALKQADATTYNNLAWWYATNPDSTIRDGKKAVKYATEACELTHYNNFAYVDTLAAAYAESDDFVSAMRWQSEAIRICNDPIQKRQCEERLKQYRLKEPYRE
jgi:tetratricopeptide (TPR) repeat protein